METMKKHVTYCRIVFIPESIAFSMWSPQGKVVLEVGLKPSIVFIIIDFILFSDYVEERNATGANGLGCPLIKLLRPLPSFVDAWKLQRLGNVLRQGKVRDEGS
jgi:hypothetical protein